MPLNLALLILFCEHDKGPLGCLMFSCTMLNLRKTNQIGLLHRQSFQYLLEGLSETSNDQALLNPLYHYIKMKAYMRVEGRE